MPVISFSQDIVEPIQPDEVYNVVDEKPQFPGGIDSLKIYIDNHIIYPITAIENNAQGIVYVKFVITKEGRIIEAVVLKGVSPAVDTEAKRVIMEMPNWLPGKNKGENVAVNFTIPVRFDLSEDQTSYTENDEIIELEEDDFEEAPDPIEDQLFWGDDELPPTFPNDNDLISWEESDPSFPGGYKGLQDYIQENLEYPIIDCVMGVVYVQFRVDSVGVVKDVRVLNGVSKTMDAAALKLVSNMPNWTPGTKANKPVSNYMTLPVRFNAKQEE